MQRGWVLAATFACLPDPEEVRQASKRRRPPPSPSVSQMAWSCDDTKVLYALEQHWRSVNANAAQG